MQVTCSDGTAREVDDAQVATLLASAQSFGLDARDLDEPVHSCCDMTASSRVNNDTVLLGLDIEDAHDVAYVACGDIGSQVNNGGPESQVAFLLAELGHDGALRIVQSVGVPG